MRSKFIPILLLAAAAWSPARADTRLGDGCDLSILGVKDKAEFLRFDSALKAALEQQDAAALALLVRFALRVNQADGSRISLDNAAALQSQFAQVFGPAVRAAVTRQKPDTLFCKPDGGVMYGDGEVWADRVEAGRGRQFRVTTVNVPAGGQNNYVFPQDVGAKFESTGHPFYALQAITTPEPGNDNSAQYNWGFSLIPQAYLTPMVVLGYAPGSSDLTQNYSGVWIAPEANTTVYVDRDGNTSTGANTDANGNKYDFSCTIDALVPRIIDDDGTSNCYLPSAYAGGKGTGDADMTGARIYTLDGTPLAAAWGQIAGLNQNNPAIDMGTTVLPFPTVDLNKTSDIVDDDGDGLADPGETIR